MPLEMRLYAPPPSQCHLIYITPLLQLKRALNSVLVIPIRDCDTGEIQILAGNAMHSKHHPGSGEDCGRSVAFEPWWAKYIVHAYLQSISLRPEKIASFAEKFLFLCSSQSLNNEHLLISVSLHAICIYLTWLTDFPKGSAGKESIIQETQVRSLGQEDPLE